MKLYATITSERATKGQGGNEFLQVQFQNINKIVFGSLAITPAGRVYGSIHGQKIDILPIFTEEEKGEKQECTHRITNEKGICTQCGYNTQHLTNKEIKGEKQKGETLPSGV